MAGEVALIAAATQAAVAAETSQAAETSRAAETVPAEAGPAYLPSRRGGGLASLHD